MVKVQYRGRLGNRLFQYCLGRIIATRLGFALKAAPIPGFPGTGNLGGKRGFLHFLGGTERIGGQTVNLQRLLANPKPRQIMLRGHFMQYDLYRDYKTKIKLDWLSQPDLPALKSRNLGIHIRSGDIWQNKRKKPVHPDYMALPLSFYRRIIDMRDWSDVTVVTENPDDPIARKLVELYDARLQSGTVIEDFSYLRASSNIVMSVSTFSWWAAWLSDAARVFYPNVGFLNPVTRPDVNLVVDEARYQLQEVAELAPWSGSKADLKRLLDS